MVKPMMPIVGNIAMKKKSQPIRAARVQRREMSSSGIKMQVPITPARTIGWERFRGSGKG
ncbi:MAG: hypothetical protein ABR913_10890 [Sedimentisphaerales bacterium]